MKQIKLSNSDLVVTVDDEWYAPLVRYSWIITNKGYAYRMVKPGFGIMMHRVINMTPEGLQTDHINGDKLDNRVANLQSCTNAENARKRHRTVQSKSGFRGVSGKNGRFQASIMVDYKKQYLGMFETAEEAARAYDAKAIELHKSFAYLNFPESSMQPTADE